jgi:hypothetical protein
MAINLLRWTPHLAITKSMKSKKKKRKEGNLLDVSCFVWGRIMLGQCFLFSLACVLFFTHTIYITKEKEKKNGIKKVRWGWSGQTPECPFFFFFLFCIISQLLI